VRGVYWKRISVINVFLLIVLAVVLYAEYRDSSNRNPIGLEMRGGMELTSRPGANEVQILSCAVGCKDGAACPHAFNLNADRVSTGASVIKDVRVESNVPFAYSNELETGLLLGLYNEFMDSALPGSSKSCQDALMAEFAFKSRCVALILRAHGYGQYAPSTPNGFVLQQRDGVHSLLSLGAKFDFSIGMFPAYDRFADRLSRLESLEPRDMSLLSSSMYDESDFLEADDLYKTALLVLE